MRYFILSDVHANLEALKAVLEDMQQFQPRFQASDAGEATDTLINLGDTVGYMPHPNEVMDALWPICDAVLPGNHDLEIAHLFRCSDEEMRLLQGRYNDQAFWSLAWTKRALSPLNRERLQDLAQRQRLVIRKDHLVFAHASPAFPERMYYIDGTLAANELFFSHSEFSGTIAFVGHIHIPQLYTKEPNGILGGRVAFGNPKDGQAIPLEKRWRLKKGETALVVVPSGGQPRDRLYYSGYAIYDEAAEELIMRRVPYNVINTQAKMQSLGFPPKLWGRLAHGT